MHRCCWIVLLLLLSACGGGGGGTSSDLGPVYSPPDLSDVTVFQSAGPYADVLQACATATSEAQFCTLSDLPLIGQEAAAPTVSDVMARVLVSHPWMAVRFEEALNQLPEDILTLFKGVTAVVIDSDILPSYYSSGTAAIYLDPSYLWLTNEEKATVTKASDYRSNFGSELQFIDLWRYVRDNDYAYAYYSLSGTETRHLEDILYPLARILYHELAHANDFLPPALQEALDLQATPLEAARTLADQQVAAHLQAVSPLTSSLWYDLAEVLFQGVTPTAEQRGYSAGFAGADFGLDVANDPYDYASIREDVAMLFEETMMKYHFDIDRDIAFTDRPLLFDPVCDDYPVHWGVRNRISDPLVKFRAAQVASELLPTTDLSGFFAGLPIPTPLIVNLGWCSNLNPGGVTPFALQSPPAEQAERVLQDSRSPEF